MGAFAITGVCNHGNHSKTFELDMAAAAYISTLIGQNKRQDMNLNVDVGCIEPRQCHERFSCEMRGNNVGL